MSTVCAQSLVFGFLTFAPASLMAQDAGPSESPVSVVRAALGGATPRLSRTVRQRVAPARDVVIPLRAERGECFEVVGYATGATRVSAEVELRGVPVASEVVLTNSLGTPGRGSFCASLGGLPYELRVRAEGPAWWSLSVLVAPAMDSGVRAPDVLVVLGEGPRPPSALRAPIGGTETDYVARQLRSMALSRSLTSTLGGAERWTLDTNAFRELSAMVPSGQCVELLASGVPSVGDLTLELYDPTGNRVALDSTHLGSESVRYCPSYAGVYRARVRVFSGAGLVGAQLMSSPR